MHNKYFEEYVYLYIFGITGHYLIGDSAYPLSRYVQVPYRDNGHLTDAQKNYNKRLSSCRIFVEHSLGILKKRFPQLFHISMKGHARISHFIRACMVLHNLADGEEMFQVNNEELGDQQPREVLLEVDEIGGQILRNNICQQIG